MARKNNNQVDTTSTGTSVANTTTEKKVVLEQRAAKIESTEKPVKEAKELPEVIESVGLPTYTQEALVPQLGKETKIINMVALRIATFAMAVVEGTSEDDHSRAKMALRSLISTLNAADIPDFVESVKSIADFIHADVTKYQRDSAFFSHMPFRVFRGEVTEQSIFISTLQAVADPRTRKTALKTLNADMVTKPYSVEKKQLFLAAFSE